MLCFLSRAWRGEGRLFVPEHQNRCFINCRPCGSGSGGFRRRWDSGDELGRDTDRGRLVKSADHTQARSVCVGRSMRWQPNQDVLTSHTPASVSGSRLLCSCRSFLSCCNRRHQQHHAPLYISLSISKIF
jgi:hypothetical protein